MISNWWKVHADIISLWKNMSNSILTSFVWKLLGTWDVGLRDVNISRMINDRNEVLEKQKFLKLICIKSCKVSRS